jgi:predicted O-methyltransferase YrrM
MRARDIPGWMPERELAWLERMAKQCNLIVEIGAWFGRSACAMGEEVLGKVITIDRFDMDGVPLRWKIARDAHQGMKTDPEWIYHRCLENLSELIKKGKIEVIKGDSCEVIKSLDGVRGKVDMVFIDGCHEYQSVKADILNYRPLLRKGGILCGHDFAYQVKKAVMELVPGYRVARRTSIWAVREN